MFWKIDDMIAALEAIKQVHGNIPVYMPAHKHGVEPIGDAIVSRGTSFVTLLSAMKS